MTVQHESEGPHEVLTQRIEMRGRNLERRATHVAGEVPVDGAGEVEDRGVLVEVRVHDDLHRLELLEDSIDRRGADVRLARLYLLGYLLGGEVTVGGDQDLGDGALGDGDPFRGPTNRRENLVDGGARLGHAKTLRPSDRLERAEPVDHSLG